ncbi:MAG: hypothetical protein AAF443_03325 [Chlamydiota bacterium]
MVSKSIFQILPLIAITAALWIGGSFGFDLYRYFRLSAATSGEIQSWEVEEYQPGKFAICVNYQFQIRKRRYNQKFHFSKPVYRNPYIAEDHIKQWEKQDWKVWYDPRNPTVSSLQKLFPFKKGIHLILCMSVAVYFVWLKMYIKRHSL